MRKKIPFKTKLHAQKSRRLQDNQRLSQTRPATAALRLALALRIEREIEAGEWEDMAAVARAHGLTRARLSQIMNLLLLAPDIQEEVLRLRFPAGKELVNERTLRRVLRSLVWQEQREVWESATNEVVDSDSSV